MSLAAVHWILWLLIMLYSLSFHSADTWAEIHRYTFNIKSTTVTKLCNKHERVTVNGHLPGPTVYVRNGDRLLVKVHNKAQYNATIHWHGVRQFNTAWSDGPEYITQCPIQPGRSMTYKFSILDQEGTLWWHAHVSWLRATLYGAIVIYPKKGTAYPFPRPTGQATILLGEWWNSNPIDVINEAIRTGGAPNVSDAFTINGQPGDLYPCSSSETFTIHVKAGQTYLVRIVNAALNNELFFQIANHNFTVVNVDAAYTKPYNTDVMMVTPGQSADILVTANQPPGKYFMAARSYTSLGSANIDNTTTTAILHYEDGMPSSSDPILPSLPPYNDTATASKFSRSLRSLATPKYPIEVPLKIDDNVVTTLGLGLLPCPPNQTCAGPNGFRLAASMNNISFVKPSIAILQAYYFHITGVFTSDFPSKPPVEFNYTGQNISSSLWIPVPATRAKVLKFNATVQLVLQGTSILFAEDHPMHLHGYSFYIVGQGFGNYDAQIDPLNFNLIDPPLRNTVGVPLNGWVAVRFKADNPGVWYMHCHYDDHLTWGLSMVFIVENGLDDKATLKPPPPNLPRC